MRKIYVLIGILVVMAGLLTNHIYGFDKDIEESDYDIAMMHAAKVYGDNYENIRVIICEDTDEEYIHYECFKGDKYLHEYRIYRDVTYDCLTGYYDNVQD